MDGRYVVELVNETRSGNIIGAASNNSQYTGFLNIRRQATDTTVQIVHQTLVTYYADPALTGLVINLVPTDGQSGRPLRGTLELHVTGLVGQTIDWLSEFSGLQIVR